MQPDLPEKPCPICDKTHDRCQFTAGSMFCVKDNCRNPHHRSRS